MKRRTPSTMLGKLESSSTKAKITKLVATAREKVAPIIEKVQVSLSPTESKIEDPEDHGDRYNYALLIVLYTLQGIPIGLSASIPFLLQEKIKKLTAAAAINSAAAATGAAAVSGSVASVAAEASRLSYNANAIFALCSWPFSLKLLWAPLVDSVFFRRIGRRKSWLVPVQTLAGLIMVSGSNFVERQLGLGAGALDASMNVKGVTAFFFVLYFLMATQDIAVDGWALTMLSKKNRGRGPICNSIGQNIGYFLSFVGFLALNDPESSETLWRPMLRRPSIPGVGLVSLGGFIRFMGYFMLATTFVVALFKRELPTTNAPTAPAPLLVRLSSFKKDDDAELDASVIGLKETYHRLWAVCQLPAVRSLFLILITYRLPAALSDNVKFLKAAEFGLSKSTTALLSPTVILPLGILVPIVASKIWHGHPLRQFSTAFKFRVTLVPLLDILMLLMVRRGHPHSMSERAGFWTALVASTAMQAICNSLQFNAQMTFFASRVDPAIGGSYMTLLNSVANIGGTWPASFILLLQSALTRGPECTFDENSQQVCVGGRDPYFMLQLVFSGLGLFWIIFFGRRIRKLAALPDDAWRTHLLDSSDDEAIQVEDVEEANYLDLAGWSSKNDDKRE
jgi:PAT family acetyl-CoA transporter-like MFS transporter 1